MRCGRRPEKAERHVFVKAVRRVLVELSGIEPLTFSLRTRRSTN